MAAPDAAPFVTVVIPIRNEERFIAGTLLRLLAQDYPRDRFELLVADGASTDRTREIVGELARAHPQIRLLDNPGLRSSAGRNVGFREGRGDVFVVVDGHCHIESLAMLSDLAGLMERTGADCLGRPQPLDPPGLSAFQRWVARARGSWLGHGAGSLIYSEREGFASPQSNGAAYRRCVFERIGYVDEAFDACEDVEFNYRVEKAGFASYTSPKLTVRYYPRETLGGLFRQMRRYGLGRWRLARKHPDTIGLTMLVPLGVLAGAAVTALAALLAPDALATRSLLAVYALYFTLILLESLRLWVGAPDRRGGVLPFIFLCIHAGLGVGMLDGLAEQLAGKPRRAPGAQAVEGKQ